MYFLEFWSLVVWDQARFWWEPIVLQTAVFELCPRGKKDKRALWGVFIGALIPFIGPDDPLPKAHLLILSHCGLGFLHELEEGHILAHCTLGLKQMEACLCFALRNLISWFRWEKKSPSFTKYTYTGRRSKVQPMLCLEEKKNDLESKLCMYMVYDFKN